MRKFTIESHTRDVIDQATGEIHRMTDSKTIKVKLDESDKFFQIYFSFLSGFYDLKHADDYKLIIKFSEIAEFNTGTVVLSPSKRDELEKSLNISENGFTKSLKRLKDLKLISGSRGTFIINPEIFWKGDYTNREKLLNEDGLKLIFEFKKKK